MSICHATRFVLSSAFFAADWYIKQYPDVELTGLNPALHYLKYGSHLGRDPSPEFSTSWYLSTYSDVMEAGQNPLVHFLLYGQKEGRLPKPNRALELDRTLWREEETKALPRLNKLLNALDAKNQEVSFAAWALARWWAFKGDWYLVSGLMQRFFEVQAPLPSHFGPQILYLDALIKTHEFDTAENRLKYLLKHFPQNNDLYLIATNLILATQGYYDIDSKKHSDRKNKDLNDRVLDWINKSFHNNDLRKLTRINNDMPATIDNIKAIYQNNKDGVLSQKALVTVIVPSYNAERTLCTALRGLLEQTWHNLEILVVNDSSTDNTLLIAENFAMSDSRVRVISHSYNQGSYIARNTGLTFATGDYITTHDADDWSHPEKIEKQVQILIDNNRYMASASHWVRCTSEMEFGRWRIEDGWTYRNISSLMFRRAVFNQLGFWDRVSVNADTEYYYRIIRAYGLKSIVEVLPDLPLAFGRHLPDSLSQNCETHLKTQFKGLRKNYHDAALKWHNNIKDISELYMAERPPERLFPAPDQMIRN